MTLPGIFLGFRQIREYMKEFFFWDTSTHFTLFAHYSKKETTLILKDFERGKLGQKLPDFFKTLEQGIALSVDTPVYMGAGPGSFTGIKTGASIFLSYLYTKGVFNINMISSLDIFSLFVPYYEDMINFILFPFNSAECFLTIYKYENGRRYYLERDKKINFSEIDILLKKFNYDVISLFSVDAIPPEIENVFRKNFSEILFFTPKTELFHSYLPELPVLKKINIARDPLILNYILPPANLKGNGDNFYLTIH